LSSQGELDVAAVPVLDNVVREVLASGERDLRLNASALTFLDARGIGCLLEARLKTLAADGRFTVSSLSGSPLRGDPVQPRRHLDRRGQPERSRRQLRLSSVAPPVT
jgi:hypothetical protein